MPRGGYRPNGGGARPGAGRPVRAQQTPPDIAAGAVNADMTPLEYMLAVMRDPTADDLRRDRMAQSAAPYVHVKAADSAIGKKEQADVHARNAEVGTRWENLLN
jgi:hypothetical protein